MKQPAIPDGAYLSDLSARFNQNSLPRWLRVFSPLPQELWGRVQVLSGEVRLIVQGAEPVTATPERPAVIPESTEFRIEATGAPCLFYIEYWHEPKLKDATELGNLLGGGRGKPHEEAQA